MGGVSWREDDAPWRMKRKEEGEKEGSYINKTDGRELLAHKKGNLYHYTVRSRIELSKAPPHPDPTLTLPPPPVAVFQQGTVIREHHVL